MALALKRFVYRTPPRIVFHFDSSADIPEPFNDDCFDEFGKQLDVSTSTTDARISVSFDDEHTDADFQQAVLNAFTCSKFFQTRAKQIKSIELEKLSLNDWMLFLESFTQHEPKLRDLSLSECHFTQEGARAVGWLLDNNASGIEIETLTLDRNTGDSSWISGLSKNTTIKNLTARKLECGLEFLNFLGEHSSLNQFEEINCDNLHNDVHSDISSGNDKFWVKIKLGVHEIPSSRYGNITCVQMTYRFTSDGTVSLTLEGHDEWQGNLDVQWKAFRNLLNFQNDKRKAFQFRINNFSFESSGSFFQAIAGQNNAPLKDFCLRHCHLSKDAAIQLRWLLDTDASGVDVKALRMSHLNGSTEWVSGFYKNKSIKSIYFSDLAFWHTTLHFLLNGNANKLKSVCLSNLVEEENGKPYCVDDDMLANVVSTNNETTVEVNGNLLASLETFTCGRFFCDDLQDIIELPKNVCESIGTVLRRASNLKSLDIKNARINPGYDFLQDAVSCRVIELNNTDFEPHILASLINGGGQLLRLDLRGFAHDNLARGDKVVKLLELADLTFLDHLIIGEWTEGVLRALCHQFRQNKGPRKFTWWPFRRCDEDDLRDILNTLGSSLACNTKIEALYLLNHLSLGVREIMQSLIQFCKMPSLKICRVCQWEPNEQQEHAERDVDEFKQFVIKQNLGRNIEVDCSPLLTSRYSDHTLSSMLKTFWRCNRLLGSKTNDLPDSLWANIYAHATEKSGWQVYKDATPHTKEIKRSKDMLFYLVRQLPRLFQQAGDQERKDERSSFTVPHHPNCPACHKRQKLLNP